MAAGDINRVVADPERMADWLANEYDRGEILQGTPFD